MQRQWILLGLVLAVACNEQGNFDRQAPEEFSQIPCKGVGGISNLEPGDIILRRGAGMTSHYIMESLNEPIRLSHTGVFVPQGDTLKIAHSEARPGENNDLFYVDVPYFANGADSCSCYIVRPRISAARRERLAAEVAKIVAQGAEFDYGFDLEENTRIYCTELLYLAYVRAEGPNSVPLKNYDNDFRTIPINHFLDTSRFEILYRPSDFR